MTQTLQDAIDFVVTNGRGGLGTPIFWAVTNGNFDIQFDEVCSYANTIHVGRSTRMDLEDNCGHGPELDFLATGVDVHSTGSNGGYRNDTGTSFAAPTAAGVGALVLAANPNLTWQEVRQTLRDSCDQIGGVVYDAAGHNDDYGWGRVNAAEAICRGSFAVTLQTPSVVFNDVPEGELTARADRVLGGQLRDGHVPDRGLSDGDEWSGSFGTLPSPQCGAAGGVLDPAPARPVFGCLSRAVNDGDITAGEVTVRLCRDGRSSGSFRSRPTRSPDRPSPVLLVLDQSGSMQDPSGLSGLPDPQRRAQVRGPGLRQPVAGRQRHRVVVDFDHDAYLTRMVVQYGRSACSAFDPTRATAPRRDRGARAQPGRDATAIGDGAGARPQLCWPPRAGFDNQAMIVFTHGLRQPASPSTSPTWPACINEARLRHRPGHRRPRSSRPL